MVKRESRSAFTLIEMMVVVAIIGILIASVFKLIGAAGENTKKALTVARIEKLANALAGYYAEYGTYPPVKKVRSSDPFVEDDGSGENHSSHSGTLTSGNAVAACRAQPVSFEFPNIEDLDDYVNIIYAPSGKISVNQALGAQKWQGEEWSETRIFKFGLLSYLLRALPFLLFGGAKTPPRLVTYVGRVLSPAAIAMLVVYCYAGEALKPPSPDASCLAAAAPYLAGTLTVALQLVRRNPLISILAGTALYMALVH